MILLSGRRRVHHRLLLLGAAVAGGALAAKPTGVGPLDVAWSAAFVATLAACARDASRLVSLGAAGAAAILAGTGQSLGLAIAAVVLGAVNAGRVRASGRWSMATGALLGLSLLTGSGPDSRILAALTTTAIAGAVVVGGFVGMGWQRRRKVVRYVIAGSGVFVLFAGVGVVAAVLARSDVDRGIRAFEEARDVGTGGDLGAAVEQFRRAERAFLDASGPLDGFGRLGRIVPGLSQQLGAASAAVEAAGDAAQAARRAGTSVDLDAVGVRGGAIDLAALRRTEAPVAALEGALRVAHAELRAIDRSLLLGPVSDGLDDAIREAGDALRTADRLHRAVEVAPALLGEGKPTRYLILFTSPVEARNRLGFPGAFAVLRFEEGRLLFEYGGASTALNKEDGFEQLALRVPARAQPYLGYGVSREWRSVTMPVHAPAAAEMAVQLAVQSGLGAIDGVVFAAPEALAEIVDLVGGVEVDELDLALTKDNTVEFLTERQYLEFPELGQAQRDRKDLLELVSALVGADLQSVSLPEARDLVDRFGPLVERGQLLVSVPRAVAPTAADLLADVGLDGGFPRPGDGDRDVVFVGQRNYAGNKIDLFLERTLAYDVSVDDAGALEATLTIELENTAPASGLPEYLIGSANDLALPPGTNLTTTLVYSRHELAGLTLDGLTTLPPVFVDGGLFVYQVEVELGPGERRTIEARFEGTAPGSGPHEVVVLPSGLHHPDSASVTIRDARGSATEATQTATVRDPLCVSSRPGGPACR